MKSCKQCDTKFETTQKKKRLCPSCIVLNRISTNKTYYKKNKEKCKEYNKKYRSKYKNIVKHKISHYKDNDKKYGRGYDNDDYITSDWINAALKVCNCRCTYCDKELKLENYEKQDPDMFSIDRKDSSKPHTIKPKVNVVVCCNTCNKKKGRKTFKDYINSIE